MRSIFQLARQVTSAALVEVETHFDLIDSGRGIASGPRRSCTTDSLGRVLLNKISRKNLALYTSHNVDRWFVSMCNALYHHYGLFLLPIAAHMLE